MKKRSNWLMIVVMLAGLVLLAACGGATQTGEEQTPAATGEAATGETVPTDETAVSPATEGETKTLYVGPELVDCVGVGPMQCMQVKENPADEYSLFYQQIEGFTFEPGYEYELLVNVTTIENPPADGSSLRYTLVEVVSQTPVAAAPAEAAATEGPALVGALWQAQTIQGAAVVADAEVTAVFGADGSLGGRAGCNNYFTTFQVDGQTITIDPQIGSTMMACPDPIMQQETAFLAALPTAATFQIQGDSLELLDANGASVATFAVVMPTPLVGTTWQLNSFNNGLGGVTSLIAGSEITAVFSTDGTMTGNAGCNNYVASYTLDGSNIAIDANIIVTSMACADQSLMDQEAAYLAALPNAATFAIQGDTLELRDEAGALIASYTAVAPAALSGVTWQLTSYNNGQDAVVFVAEGLSATAVFAEDGTLSGKGGCNNFNTSYTITGSNISINDAIASTMMACGEAEMQLETAFLAALPSAATFTIQGDVLELRDANGALVASFTAAAATDLVGPTWTVITYNNGAQAAVSVITGTEITMIFGEDGNVQGSAGCNQYFGPYTLNGEALTVGLLATTRAYCPEPANMMQQEAQFLAALQSAASFTIQGGMLDIRTADGAIAVIAAAGSN